MVVALLFLVVGVPAVFAAGSYKVQPGDTLISIAARYGVTVDAIVTANNLPNRSTIYAGQTLTIPSPGSQQTSPRPPAGGSTYVVQTGDTLSDIAVRYGTTIDALIRANGLGSTTIYAGQVLAVGGQSAPPPAPTATTAPAGPQPPQPQANPATYKVQPGDSLIAVAQRFGVSREALAAANGISPSSYLYVGQVINIPGNNQPAPTQPPATHMPVPPTSTSAPAVPVVTATQPPAPIVAAPTTTPQPAQAASKAEPGKPVQYTVQAGDTLANIAVRFSTTVEALMQLNKLTDPNLVTVGQVLTIVKGNDQNNNVPITAPVEEPAPPMGAFGPKWIDVSIGKQVMTAYEGQTPVYSSKMSSGLPRHPTVEGTYRVYAKYASTTMKGGEGAEYYYLPNVPYTMYFYSGYALHGAYWHNNFGQPMSHGCVNLPVEASKWMFNWAPIGTMVVTHK